MDEIELPKFLVTRISDLELSIEESMAPFFKETGERTEGKTYPFVA